MLPPFGAPSRSVADEMLEEAREAIKQERAVMCQEQLMKLELQIEALKERGGRGENVGERLRELRRSHYEGNGADGG